MNKLIFILLVTFASFAQKNNTLEKSSLIKSKNNSLYLEDQLYIGVTFNVLRKLPKSIKQSGFSNGLFLGFIKDFPINKKRNIGFGLGLGYEMDTYFQNLKIYTNNNVTVFENFLENETFKNNKLVFHSLAIPLELRFRTSTPTDYKFWRLYTGIKFKYIFYNKAAYKNNETQKISNIEQLNDINYGLTLSIGHGTWNAHIFYGMKNLFNNANFNGAKSIEMKDLKIGLVFYIL